MSMPLPTVCEKMAARIAELPADDYQRDASGKVTDSWTESINPFGPEGEGKATTHLEYAVLPRRSPASGTNRDGVGDWLELASLIDVIFRFELRHDSQVTDWRRAMKAAMQIVKAINDTASWAPGELNVEILERFAPRLYSDQLTIDVVVSFRITHEEGL